MHHITYSKTAHIFWKLNVRPFDPRASLLVSSWRTLEKSSLYGDYFRGNSFWHLKHTHIIYREGVEDTFDEC